MKRVTKQRRFGPGEFSSLAKQCVDVILRGQSVIDFLRERGADDPQAEWYDVRRWIKSNEPELYAQIPMNLRIEFPVRRTNQPKTLAEALKPAEGALETIGNTISKAAEEAKQFVEKEEAKMPAEETKRKPGRPARVKDEGEPVQEKKPRKAPQRAKAKVQVNSVKGKDLNYVLANENVISISNATCRLQLTTDEIRNMLSELPEVLKLFET